MRVPSRLIAGAGALALSVLTFGPASPAAAQQAPAAPGAFADAFGLLVDVTALANTIPVEAGPISDASSSCPPETGFDEDEVLDVRLPGGTEGDPTDPGGQVATSETLTAQADTDCVTDGPDAFALARTERATVLTPTPEVPGSPSLLTATVIESTATAVCGTADQPALTGMTRFVELTLANPNDPTGESSITVPANPPPNTRIDIPGLATVILNEQTFSINEDGTAGTIVVNGVHIIGASDLLRGDIIISHAVAGVAGCAAGTVTPPVDEDGEPIEPPFSFEFDKTAEPTTADPGDTVTYTVTVTNPNEEDCDVLKFVDHLNPVFQFVSTAGDFGATPELRQRADGGTDVVLSPTETTIPAGGSVTQTYVVLVKPTTGPGTYFNVVEIFCSQQGNFASPPLAGVTVPAAEQPGVQPVQQQQPAAQQPAQQRQQLPRTGGAPLLAAAALLAVGGGLFARRFSRS